MQFALVDGQRQTPQSGLKGTCPSCGQASLSKCGSKIIWHWAHNGKRHCDPWWENETEWHRKWKSLFSESQREVVHFDQLTGEKHVADIKTSRGMVIELQHSAMPIEELRAREAFYKRMIWIVDAQPFASQFERSEEPLPHPKSEMCKDIRFGHGQARAFWRESEKMEGSALVEIHSSREIESEIKANYKGHHFFKWVRPRAVWFEATAPVFLDFGQDELLWMQIYDELGQRCVQRISKNVLIEKNGGSYVSHEKPPGL